MNGNYEEGLKVILSKITFYSQFSLVPKQNPKILHYFPFFSFVSATFFLLQ